MRLVRRGNEWFGLIHRQTNQGMLQGMLLTLLTQYSTEPTSGGWVGLTCCFFACLRSKKCTGHARLLPCVVAEILNGLRAKRARRKSKKVVYFYQYVPPCLDLLAAAPAHRSVLSKSHNMEM